VIIDTEALFHRINSDLAACSQTLEAGLFSQVAEDAREERRELRDIKTWLARIETYASQTPGEQ
jgi:hypothetical protein